MISRYSRCIFEVCRFASLILWLYYTIHSGKSQVVILHKVLDEILLKVPELAKFGSLRPTASRQKVLGARFLPPLFGLDNFDYPIAHDEIKD